MIAFQREKTVYREREGEKEEERGRDRGREMRDRGDNIPERKLDHCPFPLHLCPSFKFRWTLCSKTISNRCVIERGKTLPIGFVYTSLAPPLLPVHITQAAQWKVTTVHTVMRKTCTESLLEWTVCLKWLPSNRAMQRLEGKSKKWLTSSKIYCDLSTTYISFTNF